MDIQIKHHCYIHRGATSSAGAGNRRSVSLEYLEYPLWKINVFLGVKKDTVFSQRSVGETLCCLCSRTLLRCSTPSEHFLSRLTILPLRDEQIFTWDTKIKFGQRIWKTTSQHYNNLHFLHVSHGDGLVRSSVCSVKEWCALISLRPFGLIYTQPGWTEWDVSSHTFEPIRNLQYDNRAGLFK